MRNVPFSETDLLRLALTSLEERLPKTWSLSPSDLALGPNDRGIDAILTLRAPDGAEAILLVEAKTGVDARDVPRLASQLRRAQEAFAPAASLLLVAPFLGKRARQVLASESIGYVDTTGNVCLQLERPGLTLNTSGAVANPWREERSLRSLRGPSTGRAVRALVDFEPPYGIRELASVSRTPAPTLSRVSDLLNRESLVWRNGTRGRITQVDWAGTIRRWAQDYSLTGSNRVRSYIEPRGLRALYAKLKEAPFEYAITGSVAANELNAIAEPRSATVFVCDITRAAEDLGIKTAETGANIILAEPYDPVVFERTTEENGMRYVAPTQVVVDCLTGPGRSPSEGEAVIDWMANNEEKWRVRLLDR